MTINMKRLLVAVANSISRNYDSILARRLADVMEEDLDTVSNATSDIKNFYLMCESLEEGKKIQAIKGYRAITGKGLKDSLEAVDRMMNGAHEYVEHAKGGRAGM